MGKAVRGDFLMRSPKLSPEGKKKLARLKKLHVQRYKTMAILQASTVWETVNIFCFKIISIPN